MWKATNLLIRYSKQAAPLIRNQVNLDLGTTTSKMFVKGVKGPMIISASSGVSFTPDCRVSVGDSTTMINYRDAKLIFAIKLLVGKRYSDPTIHQLASKFPCDYKLVEGLDGEVWVEVYGQKYSPVQIMAMLISHLKTRAELSMGERISQVTLLVPAYFDEVQKKGLIQACMLASLEIERVELEPIVAASSFGLLEKTKRFVLVIDCGGGSLDASLLEMGKAGVQVKVANFDLSLGGLDLNKKLLDHYVSEIQTIYGMNFQEDIRALQKFSKVIEDCRIVLSSKHKVDLKFLVATSLSGWRIPQLGFKSLNYIPTEPGLKEHSIIGDTQNLKTTGEGLEFMYGLPFGYVLSKFRFRSMKQLKFKLSRPKLEMLMKGFVEKAKEVCLRTIIDGGLEVKDINQVLLVGGMGSVPCLEAGFRDIFKSKLMRGSDFPTAVFPPSFPLHTRAWRSVRKSISDFRTTFQVQTLQDAKCRSQATFFEKYRVETKILSDTKMMWLDVCSEANKRVSSSNISEEEKKRLKAEIAQVEESLDHLEKRAYEMLGNLWIASRSSRDVPNK